MLDKRIIALIVLGLAGMTITNHYVSSSLDERKAMEKLAYAKKKSIATENKSTTQTASATIVRNKIMPEDPAKYGIISIDEADMPRNPKQWESFVKKNLQESIRTPEAQKVFQENAITRTEYNKRMKTLDEQIAELEKKQKIDPRDNATKEQLQNLYMIKSTAVVLESKMVAENASSARN